MTDLEDIIYELAILSRLYPQHYRAEGAFSVVAQIPEVGFQGCPEYLDSDISISLSLEHNQCHRSTLRPHRFFAHPTIILFGAIFGAR